MCVCVNTEGDRLGDGEAEEEEVSVGVRDLPQRVVRLLTGRVPQVHGDLCKEGNVWST